ncbi:MAG: dihydroneopterin aldolase [Candidatus Protistobacter heckmanni]|nr:dihydroneopterin aldolase [Candidatus Protistobacter heckmanni]
MHSATLNAHPALAGCRKLFLRNFQVNMDIGIYEHEKRGKQRVLINVELYVPVADTLPAHDKLSDVLDYNFIRDTIYARLAKGHIHLQETLCDDVARALLEHPKARAVCVSTEKTDAYPDCDSVGVAVFNVKEPA